MSSWARWPSNRITHSVWLRSVSMRLSVRLGRWTLALALVSAFLVLGGSIYPECFPPECPEGARCSPVCVAGLLMPGSSPLAWAGLMAASLAFGLLTIGAVRRPALTAILGLTWLAAWISLTAWISDLAGPQMWMHTLVLWNLGFHIRFGGEGYLLIMLPAGVTALLSALFSIIGMAGITKRDAIAHDRSPAEQPRAL